MNPWFMLLAIELMIRQYTQSFRKSNLNKNYTRIMNDIINNDQKRIDGRKNIEGEDKIVWSGK